MGTSAVTFELVCGATTLDLNNGLPDAAATDYWLRADFTPESVPDENGMVQDVFRIGVNGTSYSDLMANVAAIYSMCENAKQWVDNGDTVNPVYIHYAPIGTTTQRRTLVTAIDMVNGTYSGGDTPKPQWFRLFDLYITHVGYAEGLSEVSLALTNTNVTGADWARCFTCNDGTGAANQKKVNWAALSGTLIDGDLPAPTKIVFTLNGAHTLFYGVAQNIDPTGAYYWEGETIYAAGEADDAACSNAHYSTWPANTPQSFAPDGTDTKGGWFLPLVSAKISATGASIVLIPDAKVATENKTIYPSGYATNAFCLFALPPIKLSNIYNSAFTPTQSVSIQFSAITQVDFVTLIPLETWQRADSMVTTPDPSSLYACTVDTPFTCFGDSAVTLYPTAVRGPGIWLEPGKDAKIYVMGAAESTLSILTTREIDIALSYRPRWRSL